MKARRRFCSISRLKLVAMAMSLDQSGNQYQIERLHQHVYQIWKFGEDQSGSFRDVCFKRSLNKSSAEMGDRVATIDMGRKVGRGCCGVLGPHWITI